MPPPSPLPLPPGVEAFHTPDDVVEEVVTTLPTLRAAGPSRLPFECLTSAFHNGGNEAIISLIQAINAGTAHPALFDFIGDSRLVALKKPDGGVRPIAIGDCLARAAAQCVCRQFGPAFQSYFTAPPPGSDPVARRPLQLGVGTPAGAETTVHAIRHLLEANPDFEAVSNDLRNGFNSLSRAQMFSRIADSPFASMLPGIQALYAPRYADGCGRRLLTSTGPLTSTPRAARAAAHANGLRDPNPGAADADLDTPSAYSSCDGCRQGDPHGPWLFALTIHATLHKVQQAFPDVHIFCYLDDAYAVGPTTRAYAAIRLLQQLAGSAPQADGTGCTLDTNFSKVDYYSPSLSTPLPTLSPPPPPTAPVGPAVVDLLSDGTPDSAAAAAPPPPAAVGYFHTYLNALQPGDTNEVNERGDTIDALGEGYFAASWASRPLSTADVLAHVAATTTGSTVSVRASVSKADVIARAEALTPSFSPSPQAAHDAILRGDLAAAVTLSAGQPLRLHLHPLSFVDPGTRGSPFHRDGVIRGFKCLGAFIGDDDWAQRKLEASLSSHLAPLSLLRQVRDSGHVTAALQGQLLILRWCITATPNYWLRAMPPAVTIPALAAAYRPTIDSALSEILDFRPDTPRGRRALEQSSLPLPMGGLGITDLTSVAPLAFAGSMATCWSNLSSFLGADAPTLPPDDLLAPESSSEEEAAAAVSTALTDNPLTPSLSAIAHTLARSRFRHSHLAALYHSHNAIPLPGSTFHHFHPSGLPSSAPLFSHFSSTGQGAPPLQRTLAAISHHYHWNDLHRRLLHLPTDWDPRRPWDTAHANREACRFVSASAPHAHHAWEAVPTSILFRFDSRALLVATQRRLGLPLACLHGLTTATTHSARPLSVDPLGDAAQNSSNHTARHNRTAERWAAYAKRALRCTYRLAHTEFEPAEARKNPDVTLLGTAQRRTRDTLLELKVFSPITISHGQPTASDVAARAAFAATAPTARTELRTKYSSHRFDGQTTVLVGHEVFGGFFPESCEFFNSLCLSLRRSHAIGAPEHRAHASWSARRIPQQSLHAISVALHTAAAEEILNCAYREQTYRARHGSPPPAAPATATTPLGPADRHHGPPRPPAAPPATAPASPAAPPPPSGPCSACAGKHNAHTCGKQRRTSPLVQARPVRAAGVRAEGTPGCVGITCDVCDPCVWVSCV